MTISAREEVLKFLLSVKKILSGAGGLTLIHRQKNMAAIAMLGFTVNDVKKEILNLTPSNYSSGPDDDHGTRFQGEFVWIFGTIIGSDEYYIKIKLRNQGNQTVVCISFHKAKFPLKYPLRR